MDSLEDLARSQLFDTSGRTLIDASAPGKTNVAGSTTLILTNVVIEQKYKVISLLGEGGMGAVYKAHHLLLDKDVALKTFKTTSLSDDAWMRFQREAQAIARINHVNIVKIFDFGIGEQNIPYYTMECLTGQSLAERLAARGPLPVEHALLIFHQVCLGLSEAHSRGIIHRDMKPANIFLTSDFTTDKVPLVKIVDFGIAGLVIGSLDGQRLTTTGSVFGSPLYMSPEQSEGSQVTAQSDIYSCGCALFQTLTGNPPFRGENAFTTMLEHQQKTIPKLEEKCKGMKFEPAINGLLESMLAKNGSDRIQSFEDVAVQIEKICTKKPSNHPVRKNLKAAPEKSELIETGEQTIRPAQNKIKIAALALVFFVVAAAVILPSTPLFKKNEHQRNQTTKAQSETESPSAASIEGTGNNDAATQDIAAGQLHAIASYLKEGNSKLRTARTFQFPNDVSLGTLTYDLSYGHNNNLRRKLPARGRVVVPADVYLMLDGNKVLSDHPEYFDGFGPNDLDTLTLERLDDCKWTDSHIASISKLTGLRSIRLDDSDISDNCLESLNKLTSLKELGARDIALSPRVIARLKRLPQLWHLTLANKQGLSGCLSTMENSKEVGLVDLVNCDLKDSDMKLFGTMPNLAYLHVDGNQDITNKGVQAICHLKQLTNIELSHTGITPDCIPMLQKLANLRTLKISSLNFPDKVQRQLKQALPLCIVKSEERATPANVKELTDSLQWDKQ